MNLHLHLHHCCRLRDELLDAAQEAADAGPKEEVMQQSLGQALDRALQQRLQAAKQEQPKDAAAAEAADVQPTKETAAAAADANGKAPGGEAAAAVSADGVKHEDKPSNAGAKQGGEGSSGTAEVTPEMLRVLDW